MFFVWLAVILAFTLLIEAVIEFVNHSGISKREMLRIIRIINKE